MGHNKISAIVYKIWPTKFGDHCQYICVGEEIEGKFTGLTFDRELEGAVKDYEFWENGELIKIEEFNSKVKNSKDIWKKYDEIFYWDAAQYTHYFEDGMREKFKMVKNYHKLDDGIDLNPQSSRKGRTSFSKE